MTRRRRTRLPARIAQAAIGTVILGVMAGGCEFNGAYDLPLPGSPVDEDQSFEVTAEFRDILDVVPRSPVKVNDVTVGEVTDVERVKWNALVTMRIQDDVDLPANAIADVRATSLLGEKYIALLPDPSKQPSGTLADGAEIPLSSTGRNPEVEEVLGALSFLLNGGGVAQLRTISVELNKVMEGRQQRLGHLLRQLDTTVGSLDRQKQDIIRALEGINSLSRTLNRERETVVAAIDTIGPAIRILADQHRQLLTMLRSLDRLGKVGTRVITATKDDTLASLRHLRPILTKLNAAGNKLPKAVELIVSFPFPKEAQEIVKGDYANTGIKMDLSIDNILTQLGNQPGGGLPDLPDITVPDLPGANLPDNLPNTPNLPKLPKGPKLPNTPKLPKQPKAPRLPQLDLPGSLGDLLGLRGGGVAQSPVSGGLLGGGLG